MESQAERLGIVGDRSRLHAPGDTQRGVSHLLTLRQKLLDRQIVRRRLADAGVHQVADGGDDHHRADQEAQITVHTRRSRRSLIDNREGGNWSRDVVALVAFLKRVLRARNSLPRNATNATTSLLNLP